MRRILFLLLAFLCMLGAYAQVTLSFSENKIKPGETKTVSLNVLSTETVGSIQFKVYLPTGVSIPDSKASVRADRPTLSKKGPWADFDLSLSSNQQSDGSTMFFITSTSGDWPEAGEGELFTFKMVAAADAPICESNMYVREMKIANTEAVASIIQNVPETAFPFSVYAQFAVSAATANEAMGTVAMPGAGDAVASGTSLTATATPAAGYSFVNWTAGEEVVSTENPYTFTASKDMALVANFKVNQYDVKFVYGNGEDDKVTSSDFASVIPTPTNPTKTGYTFTRWEPAFVEGATVPVDGITYTAQWQINQYTITFDTDGGSAIDEIKQDYASTVTAPTAPTKTGYTFAGWDKTVPTTMPAENVTVKALWTINQYTITFDVDGGSAVEAITQNYATAVTAPAAPTKTGYTFVGWDKTVPANMPAEDVTIKALWEINQYTITFDVDGGSAIAAITQDYASAVTAPTAPTKTGYTFAGWDKTVPTTMPAENVTVKAQWTINQYTITFDVDGGSAIAAITQDYASAVTAPAAPTKTGYTFKGWDKTVPANMPAEDVTLKAQWQINQYTITFDVDGGSAIAAITQDYASAVTTPVAPTKTGYTFKGWDKEIPATIPAENVTVKAQWQINQYTITFDVDGGSAIAAITQDYASAVTAPAAPTKTGYTFKGWDKTVPANMPAENVTVKAQWQINQYTITFDVDGGSAIAAITQDYASAVTAPAAPTKTGYTFKGWDKTVPANMPAENVTVKAQWQINQYTITFDADGGSEVSAITQDYATAVTAPVAPTKTGYTFTGWDKAVPTTMPAENLALKAQWKVNQYKLTYKVEGADYKSYDVDYSAAITPEASPVKEGHTFTGWSEIPAVMPAHDVEVTGGYTVNEYQLTYQVDGVVTHTESVLYGATIVMIEEPTMVGKTFSGWKGAPTTMPARDVVITGSFDPNKYTVTYKVDGEVYKSVQIAYGSTITPEAAPTKEGYTFSGWSEIAATMPANDLEVTGTFTVNQYKVTFLSDGLTIKEDTQDFGSAITAPEDPEKIGYTFKGWDPAVDATVPSHDAVYTALFTVNQYTITFDTDGGSEITPATVDYNSAITAPEAPTKTGYTFAGWDKEIPATMPTENLTFKALWTINSYKLTYKVDGVVYMESEVEYNAAITPEAAPEKEHYTFSGWSEIPAVMPAADVEITGTFAIDQYKVTFIADGETIKEETLDYGATITAPEDPTKTGYTFTGWDAEVGTVPANDVVFEAQFKINTYKLTYILNGEVYKEVEVEYGAEITPEEDPAKDGFAFSGWSEIPATMPAGDVEVTGVLEDVTAINGTSTDAQNGKIYNMSGLQLNKAQKGLNIIGGKKILVK